MSKTNPAANATNQENETMSTTVDSLIQESVSQTKIAHADYIAELAEELESECEDSVVSGLVHEFWGTDEDGDEWRVHLTEAEVRSPADDGREYDRKMAALRDRRERNGL